MANPERESVLAQETLVSITYGSTTVLVTGSDEDLPTLEGVYLSDPLLSVKLPPNNIAGFDKSIATITMSFVNYAFATQVTSGRAFPPVYVKVKEMVNGEIKTLFTGRSRSAHKNLKGKKDLISLKVRSAKSDLDQALGFSCNATCGWVFGDTTTCKKDVESLKESGSLTIPDFKSTTVTITGLASHTDNYWVSGKVRLNGTAIKIRSWDLGTSFYLNELPPSNWHSATVEVLPGCDKTPNTCAFWDNLDRFVAPGLAALSYNPLFENPSNPYGG